MPKNMSEKLIDYLIFGRSNAQLLIFVIERLRFELRYLHIIKQFFIVHVFTQLFGAFYLLA